MEYFCVSSSQMYLTTKYLGICLDFRFGLSIILILGYKSPLVHVITRYNVKFLTRHMLTVGHHELIDSWWRHLIEAFSALLVICAGNSPVTGEFPAQRPVTRSFSVFFDLRLNKRLSKQSWGWWFETLLSPLWRHINVIMMPSHALRYTKPHTVSTWQSIMNMRGIFLFVVCSL